MPDLFACTAPLLGGEDRKNVRDEVVDLISRCLPCVSIVASEGDSSDKFESCRPRAAIRRWPQRVDLGWWGSWEFRPE